MVTRDELVAYLDTRLDVRAIPMDKSANGLQVEGRQDVHTVVGAVDASLQLYHAAAEAGADFIFVHHGEFWGDGFRSLTGRFAQRFGMLFRHHLSLYAAHLPLDAHPTLGHNAVIADRLGLVERAPFAQYAGAMIGVCGRLPAAMTLAELQVRLDQVLTTKSSLHGPDVGPIRSVGIVSGSGVSAIGECQRLGLDCLITGDLGHTDYHPILETGVPVLIGGHYKTEAPGIEAVLAELGAKFAVTATFIDLPTNL